MTENVQKTDIPKKLSSFDRDKAVFFFLEKHWICLTLTLSRLCKYKRVAGQKQKKNVERETTNG